MDVSSWKRILLNWITKCDFLERSFYNIEQSDVEGFFQKFLNNFDRAKSEGLIAFFRDEYPEIELILDDNNALSSVDYIYVYSLLLHYSCVKSPHEFFHKTCQQLHESYQQAIASFFTALLEEQALTKSTIRHAIASVKITSPLPRQISIESPRRTPRKNNRISPQTPKTFMLEERNRELNNLRAQLETERYEKGFLEVNLKQSEDKIYKLVQDQKRNIAEIQQLKNQLLEKNTENCSPNKSIQDEQIKKRLRKSISEKEGELIKIREELVTVQEQKSLLDQKLTYSDQKVIACLKKIQELDVRVDVLTSELEQKNLTITHLTNNKLELEQFIEEMRTSPGSRLDLNMSVECLDASFSRTTNSSGSISSPENLGVSVIDIQLRDKEHENARLQDEIQCFESENTKLSQHIADIISRHSDVFVESAESLLSNDLNENFVIFTNCVEKLLLQYSTSLATVNQLKSETQTLAETKNDLDSKVKDLERQLEVCRETLLSVEDSNKSLIAKETDLTKKSEEYQFKIDKLLQDKVEVLNQLNELQNSYEQSYEQNVEHLSRIKELTVVLEEKTAYSLKFDEANTNLQRQVDMLSIDIQKLNTNTESLKKSCFDLETFKTDLEEQKQKLEADIEVLNEKLVEKEKIEIALNTKHLSLLSDYEQLKLTSEEQNYKLEADLQDKDLQMQTLNEEIQEVKLESSTLSEKFNSLTVLYTNQHQLLNGEAEKWKENVAEKETMMLKLKSDLTTRIEWLEREKCNLKEEVDNAEKKIEEIQNCSRKEIVHLQSELETAKRCLEEHESIVNVKIKDMEQQLLLKADKLMALQISLEQNINDKESLKTELATLSNNHKLKEEDLKDLQTKSDKQIESLKADNSNLSSELQKCENTLQNEHQQHEKLQSEITRKVLDIESLEKVTASLQDQFENSQKECKTLKTTITDLQSEISSLQSEKESSQEIYQSLEEKLSFLESQLAANNLESTKQISDLQNLIHENHKSAEKLEEEKSELNDLANNLQTQLTSFLEKHEENMSALKISEEEKSQLTKKLEETKNDLLEFEMVCAEVKENLNRVNDENLSLAQSVADKKLVIETLRSDAEQLKADNEKLTGELSKLNKSLEEQIAKSQGQCKHFENYVEDLILKLEKHVDLSGDSKEIQNIFEADSSSKSKMELLKLKLNLVLNNLLSIKMKNLDNEKVISNLSNSLSELSDENKKLNGKLERSERNILRLREDHMSDAQTIENKLSKEISCLNENINNLNDVHDKLNKENYDLQTVRSDLEQQVKDAAEQKSQLLDQLSAMEAVYKEASDLSKTLKQDLDVLTNKSSRLENMLLDTNMQYDLEKKKFEDSIRLKNEEIQSLTKKVSEENIRMEQVEKELRSTKEILEAKEIEFNGLKITCDNLIQYEEQCKKTLEDLSKKCQEVEILNANITALSSNLESLKEELKRTKLALESTSEYEHKFQQLQLSYDELEDGKRILQNDLDSAQAQLECKSEKTVELFEKNGALEAELKALAEKFALTIAEVEERKEEIVNLSTEVQLLCREKETILEERQTLCEKLSDGNLTKAKILELENTIQDMQFKQLELHEHINKSESALSVEKSKCSDLQNTIEKLNVDNLKAQENATAHNKRMEKQALKLGDSLAKASKLERENESLKKSAEVTKVNMQATSTKLSNEVKSLTEKLSKAERAQDQLSVTLRNVEDENKKLLKAEQDIIASNEKLKKERDAQEVKMKKLSNTLNENCIALKQAEQRNVELTLEIGSLNKTIQEHKNSTAKDLHEVTENLIKMKNSNLALKECNEDLSDQLSKLKLQLDIIQTERENLQQTIEDLKTNISEIRTSKEQIENEHLKSKEEMKEFEIRYHGIVNEKQLAESNYRETIESLQNELQRRGALIVQLKQELSELQITTTQTCSEEMSSNLETLQTSLAKEKEKNAKFAADSEIFIAKLRKTREANKEMESKWAAEREQLLDDLRKADERTNEVRLEFGGKLEKMKTKMKTLYNEQITKTKLKHDSEMAESKRESTDLQSKITKYEHHVTKLSNQIVAQTEEILELKKNNAFMETRLKDYESGFTRQFKRPQSMHAASTQAIGSIRMEDEEGEVFNNTYLADLKNDRMSENGRESISVQELQYRNSLALPHLKSTYLAQYQDHHLAEEDIKDGIAHNLDLDDSLSSLLNTGQRKKVTGTTSYKRPGPPTPSKNAGRLSFGGLAELPREVLRETFDINSKKTPSKFNFFSSKLATRTDTENSPPKRRLSSFFKKGK